MRLQTRLFITLLLALFLLLLGYQYWSYKQALSKEEENLQVEAERMRAVLMSTRRVFHHQFIESGIPLTPKTVGFLPAHALNKISKDYNNWDNSGFSFNNVSDKPRNPNQAADHLELEAMEFFRKNPKEDLLFKSFKSSNDMPFYLYARPIWIEGYCLKCHGKKLDAPATIQKLYDTAYDYKLGDLRGILSIKVPASTVKERALAEFKRELIVTMSLFILAISIILIIIRHYVGRPLHIINSAMGEVGSGNYKMRIDGLQGEFASLGDAFNKMSEEVMNSQVLLADTNVALEKRVKEELVKSREKDYMLIQQSRLAAMGEMIGHIAHQWRQPINLLGLLLVNIKDDFEYDELDKAGLDTYTSKAEKLIEKMSVTIDDFRNFFNPNKEKEAFSPAKAIEETFGLIEDSFKYENIDVTIEEETDVSVLGYPNEYSQVVLNLINNARDAIKDKEVKDGSIMINVGRDKGNCIVTVTDNGGGIPEEIIEKVFDPYFSSKKEGGGTGLGLYMSKMIIEDNMGGRIEVRNVKGGARFRMSLPEAA